MKNVVFVVVALSMVLGVACSPRTVRLERNIGVPVIIDTVLRTQVEIPTVEISTPALLTTATVIAPAVMEFTHVAASANGIRKTRVRVNNAERTVVVEQEPVVAEMQFVFATVATLRHDSVATVSVGSMWWVQALALWLIVLFVVLLFFWRVYADSDR